MTETIRPIDKGQHYEHTRGQVYTVEHKNEDIVLLYDGGNYRLEKLQYFKRCLESGEFELLTDFKISESETKIPFSDIEWVGDEAIKSLEGAGLTTPKDFDYWTDERILELDSVGERTLENINEWIENNTTDTVEI